MRLQATARLVFPSFEVRLRGRTSTRSCRERAITDLSSNELSPSSHSEGYGGSALCHALMEPARAGSGRMPASAKCRKVRFFTAPWVMTCLCSYLVLVG
jgi:hypothetical protein